MQGKIKHIVQKLIAVNNVAQFLEQIVLDETIHFNEMVMAIFNHIEEINTQEKSLHLSKFIAGNTINNKCLSGLENLVGLVVNDEPNAVKKQFMKKILIEINEFVAKTDVQELDVRFMVSYARLCTLMMS